MQPSSVAVSSGACGGSVLVISTTQSPTDGRPTCAGASLSLGSGASGGEGKTPPPEATGNTPAGPDSNGTSPSAPSAGSCAVMFTRTGADITASPLISSVRAIRLCSPAGPGLH